MTSRALPALLAALLALGAPRAGAEVSLGGSAGVGYTRTDQTNVVPGQTWDFAGDLSLSAPLSPGLLDVAATGRYLGQRNSYSDVGGRGDSWSARLGVNALSETHYPLSLSAAHLVSDFSTDAAAQRTGGTVTDEIGGTMEIRPDGLPSLRAMARRAALTNHSFGVADVTGTTTALNLLAYQSVRDLNYQVYYDTSWNQGSLAEGNYQAHNLAVQTQASLASNFQAQVRGAYFLRLPTVSDRLNPRLDNEQLDSTLRWDTGARSVQTLTYTYQQSATDVVGDPLRRLTVHGVTAASSIGLGEDWTVVFSASGNVADSRAGTADVRTSGEQGGANVTWTHALGAFRLTLAGGGTAGALQAGGRSQPGYGATGSAAVSTRVAPWSATASYSYEYRKNLGGLEALGVSHVVNLLATGPSMFRGQLRANLLLRSSRNDAVLFGKTDSRSAAFDLTSTWGKTSLRLDAGLSQGLSEILQPSVGGGGTLLPVSYDTRSRSVGASGTIGTDFGLALTALARYLSIDAPGRPNQYERSLGIVATYTVGSLHFSVEDRLTGGGASGSLATTNLVMVRVTRGFGLSL